MIRSVFRAVVGFGWSLVLACGAGLAQELAPDTAANAEPQVLYLHTEFLPYERTVERGISHRLGREMIRQAVLMTARDELGLATCDETLQETVPKSARVVHLMPIERADLDGKWNVKLIPFDGGGSTWEKDYEYIANGAKMYADMVPKLEEDSRGAFLDALKSAGFTGAKPRLQDPQPPGEEIEKLLLQVDFVAQYGAVRTAHQAISERGETPQWLGVLVRGYANLALLTKHHWNSTTDVFTARSWLYAQRLMVCDQESDLALWHRAYAWALGGTLHHALSDLEELERRGQNADSPAEVDSAASAPPRWCNLIKPYCLWDRAAIKQVGQEHAALKPWTAMLWFQVAGSYRQPRWMYEGASEIRENCPTAYGVYAELVDWGGGYLALSRSGAALAPIMFGRFVPQSLLALPDVPSSIQQVVDNNRPQQGSLSGQFGDFDSPELFPSLPMMLARQLRVDTEQSAGAGLSWSALASLLEEEQFLQVEHHIVDARNAVERSFVEEVNVAMPLIKNHRFAAFIDAFRYNFREDSARVHQVLGTIKVQDPRMNMYSMLYTLQHVRDASGKGIGATAVADAHRNFTMPGLLEFLVPLIAAKNPPQEAVARVLINELRLIAPHSDSAIFLEILWAKDPTAEQLTLWESELKEDPRAFAHLAKRLEDHGDLDGAVRCCEKAVASAKIATCAVQLADLYLAQGSLDKWEQTLLEALETEDLGLEHGGVHYRLATGYVRRGQWGKAKPHAVAYGQTWAGHGLLCASEICEALSEWQESEKWIREFSQSYPSTSAYWWYYWCRRTGRGDVQSAHELAKTYFSIPSTPTRDRQVCLGVYHLLEGDARGALEAYRRALSFKPTFTCTFMVAQLSRESGDEKLRSDTLNAMQKSCIERMAEPESQDTQIDTAGLAIVQLLQTGGASEARLARIDNLLGDIDPSTRAAFAYFVAQELDALGKTAEADKYWRRALVIPDHDALYGTLAGWKLAKRHGTSRPDDDVLDETDLWPLPPVKSSQ